MLLRVLQVVGTSRVAATDRALLEVTLQDVTPAEGVLAQMALVGSLTGVCVTLESARLRTKKDTYGAADDASGASGAGTSCCNEGTRTCHLRSSSQWLAPFRQQELVGQGV